MSAPDISPLTSQFAPEIAELTERCAALLRTELPGTEEKLYAGGWKNLQFRKGGEPVVVVNPLRDHVNVNIGNATELDDPDHVLEGTGKGIRHVKTWPDKPFPDKQLKALLRQVRERSL